MNDELTDDEIEKIASKIFKEDQTYEFSDVYKFAKAIEVAIKNKTQGIDL